MHARTADAGSPGGRSPVLLLAVTLVGIAAVGCNLSG